MAQPHLPDLLIEGYRGIRRLELKKLGNVNLLVGRNGVGKSSVLEAVRLYSSQGAISDLTELLQVREEPADPGNWLRYEALFFGRSIGNPIRIGPSSNPLIIQFTSTARAIDGDGLIHFRFRDLTTGVVPAIPTLAVEQGGKRVRYAAYEPGLPPQMFELPDKVPNEPSSFVEAGGLSYDRFGKLWDRIVLTDFEEELNSALRDVVGNIQRVSMVQGDGGTRRAMAKLAGMDRPVALKTLGDGVHRFVGIALSLANAKGGFLLIDEFENGLHYKTQESLWRFLIRMARQLNVQVFATTHSRDCIGAFGRATKADSDSVGMLYRLEEFRGEIVETHFDEEEIDTASSLMVEIR